MWEVKGPYFNSLKREWEAPNASSFVGGSMAMIIPADKLLLRPTQI